MRPPIGDEGGLLRWLDHLENRSIDLNVGGPQPDQLGHFVAQDVHHVGQKAIKSWINVGRALG